MKINPIANPNILKTYQAQKPAQQRTKLPGGLDEVTFSDEALNFSKAMAQAQDKMEFRTLDERTRIAEITDAVRQGKYRIDSDKIAEKILESVDRD